MNERQAVPVFAEDLPVGTTYRTGAYEFTVEAIRGFAEQWDPLWFHLDAAQAERGPFGGLIASGLHSLAVLQRLLAAEVYSTWRIYVGRRFGSVEFLRPVRPGTRAWARLEVTRTEPRDSQRWLVTTRTELVADEGRLLSVEVEQYVWSRRADELTA